MPSSYEQLAAIDTLMGLMSGVATGRQDYVRGDGAGNTYSATAARLDAAAAQGASVTKKYWIPTQGSPACRVVLKPNVATGVPTAKLYPVCLDGTTEMPNDDGTTAAVTRTLVQGAVRCLTVSGIVAPWCVLELTTGAAEDLRFLASSAGLAEFATL